MVSTREFTFLGLWVDKLKMFCKVLSGEKQLCRGGVYSLLLQDEHIIVLCFYFSCWLWNVFFVENEKYLRLGEDEQLGSFKINTTSWVLHPKKMSDVFFLVVYFSYRPWYVLLYDGKNDRCWIVLPFWDTFNIEIDCSVMRLSCLDELLNNDILLSLSFAWYV